MHFRDLTEPQLLALAITAEEDDSRIDRDFAESLRADFPASAALFDPMAVEEDGHRHRLTVVRDLPGRRWRCPRVSGRLG